MIIWDMQINRKFMDVDLQGLIKRVYVILVVDDGLADQQMTDWQNNR